jgi:hypothetical protein
VRLDEAKLEQLRRWGHALREAESEGSAAAGRAILMLIEELERSRLELLREREQLERVDPVSNIAVAAETAEGDQVAAALRGRLQRALDRDSDEEAGPSVETSRESTSSARSWIETLRRQK